MKWKTYFNPIETLQFLISKGVLIISCDPIIKKLVDRQHEDPKNCSFYTKEEPKYYKVVTYQMLGDVVLKMDNQKFQIKSIKNVGDYNFDIENLETKKGSSISTNFRLFTPIVGLSRYARGDTFIWDDDEDAW
jgi:hypothetical protein